MIAQGFLAKPSNSFYDPRYHSFGNSTTSSSSYSSSGTGSTTGGLRTIISISSSVRSLRTSGTLPAESVIYNSIMGVLPSPLVFSYSAVGSGSVNQMDLPFVLKKAYHFFTAPIFHPLA